MNEMLGHLKIKKKEILPLLAAHLGDESQWKSHLGQMNTIQDVLIFIMLVNNKAQNSKQPDLEYGTHKLFDIFSNTFSDEFNRIKKEVDNKPITLRSRIVDKLVICHIFVCNDKWEMLFRQRSYGFTFLEKCFFNDEPALIKKLEGILGVKIKTIAEVQESIDSLGNAELFSFQELSYVPTNNFK